MKRRSPSCRAAGATCFNRKRRVAVNTDERPGTIIQAWRELTIAFWKYAEGRYDFTPEVVELANHYIQQGAMPAKDTGDALHLAFATWYRVQCLLTWNCKHLANANKFEHIKLLNDRRRLVSPMIVTPEQLLETNP